VDHLIAEKCLYCLSGTDIEGGDIDLHVYGNDQTVPHRRIEIDLSPCKPEQIDPENPDYNQGCVADLNLTGSVQRKLQSDKDYLSGAEFVIMVNQDRFVPTEYGKSAIVEESYAVTQPFDSERPSEF
jgi:hypothetical protein